ncbi:Dnal4 [Columba livia]|nr:Dnal4 [Columba livia]
MDGGVGGTSCVRCYDKHGFSLATGAGVVVRAAAVAEHTDMPEEMRVEAMELCVTACEKYATNNESAAKMIKEMMDKKFGSSWHVVIGEAFGFEITHEVKNLLYMFFGGSLAVCVWKCS